MLAASILAALEFETIYVFCLAAAANGIQNGIASIYSANLIRCSLTGSSTDAVVYRYVAGAISLAAGLFLFLGKK